MANEEHPDDIRDRQEGEHYGRAHAAEFCADHARDMQLLIETYADEDAVNLLERMREMFWVRLWTPKAGQ